MISSISRKSRTFLGKPMIAMALAVSGVAGIAASPAVQAQEGQPEIKPSPDFHKAISPVVEGFKKTRENAELQARSMEVRNSEGAAREQGRAELRQAVADDLSALRAAKDKIDNQSDRFFWGQFAVNYGVLTDDSDLLLEGIVEETASGLQTSSRKAQLSNNRAMIHFDRGEYALAREAFQMAIDSGNSDASLRNNIVVTYLREDDRAGALAYINEIIDETAAVGVPDEQLLLRAFTLARDLEVPNANDYAFRLVRFHPTTENWANAIMLVRADAALTDEAVLDLQRLMLRTDSLQNRGDVTTIVNYADYRKRPQEVLDAIAIGIEKGFLEADEAFVVQDMAAARKQVGVDQGGELASLDADARTPGGSLTTAVVAGDAFLNYGQSAKAEELYRIAMDKAGANLPELLTRIGIAQLDQGKFEEAQATFGEVSGPRASVANLWRIYALQQGS